MSNRSVSINIFRIVTADNGGNTTSVLLGNGATTTVAVNLTPLSGIGVATRNQALSAQNALDSYFRELNLVSSSIGTGLSRLSAAAATLKTGVEATKAAASRITDADIAEESARLISTQILQQAAAAVLAHASRGPEIALGLLQSSG